MENLTSTLKASLLEQVAETFGQAYFIFDSTSQNFLYLNNVVADLFGFNPEMILQEALSLLTRVHPEDQEYVLTQHQKLLETGLLEEAEFRVQVPGQDQKWIILYATILEQDGHSFITGYAENITKRREYQNNILKFNSKKNSTLEILSHDLAAPFSNIESMVTLLEDELESPGPGTLELVTYIKENAKKGSDMIRDFVDNEFLESSQVVLHKERVNLTERLQLLVENYRQTGNNLLAKRFEASLPPEKVYVAVDVMKFIQVLNNLISNAIKFTEDTGTITVAMENRPTSVVISVSDDGIGIPDDLQPLLFDKFTKARRQGVRGEKSVGLGMSIIKNIVELHQGTIWFESQEGEGSTFYVEVPKT